VAKGKSGEDSVYLVNAPGEIEFTAANQADLRKVIEPLLAGKIGVEAPFIAVDAADSVSGFVGEIIVPLANATGPLIIAALAGWFKRGERKVRFEDGDLKLEASTVAEIGELIEMAKRRKENERP
jgi:hypothetical protein